MYDQDSIWDEYYSELKPEKRRKIYEEIVRSQTEDDGANEYRKHLYELRHTDPKDPKHQVDTFLWQFLIMPSFFHEKGRKRKADLKGMRKAIAAMEVDKADELSEPQRAALYWEIRNAARRYLETCKKDGYGSRLFGFVKSNEDRRAEMSCSEFWRMSIGVAKRFQIEDEMRLLTDALVDEYALFDEDAAERFERYNEEHQDEI